MLQFDSESIQELELLMRENATLVSTEIIKNICDALENDANVVDIGVLNKLNLNIQLKRDNYLEALKVNFVRIEKAELYELCARANKWIKVLESEQ